MTTKKRKPAPSTRRQIRQLKRQLRAVEALIARLERDSSLDLAQQDHFVLWKRPSLFAPWSTGIQ